MKSKIKQLALATRVKTSGKHLAWKKKVFISGKN
jgi:hypothetical protein